MGQPQAVDDEPAVRFGGQVLASGAVKVDAPPLFPRTSRLFLMIDDLDTRAEVVSNLSPVATTELTRDMTEEVVLELLDRMEPDDATDVVSALHAELRGKVILGLRSDGDDEVTQLLAFPQDSAGGIRRVVAALTPASHGKFLTWRGEEHPW